MKIQALTVGPIIGYTTQQSIRFWGRGDKPDNSKDCFVFTELRTADGSGIIASRITEAKAEDDYTAVLDFTGLDEATQYAYRMGYFAANRSSVGGMDSESFSNLDSIPLKAVKTAELVGADISFVFGSCRRIKPGDPKTRGDKTYRSIVRQIDDGQRTDAVLMIGDQIYADNLAPLKPGKRLKGFWKLYQSAFSQPHIAELVSRVPTYMTLDDHEIKNNWTMDQVDEDRELFLDAMQAYQSYQLIHGPAFQRSLNPEDDDTPADVYYSMDIGRASFFVLDTRTERFPSHKQMISREQMQNLLGWLSSNRGEVKFIVSSVPFLPGFSSSKSDKWNAFEEQRNSIIEHVFTNQIKNVFCLCGDVHVSGHCTLTAGPDRKPVIRQLVSSQFYWPWYVRLRPTGDSEEGLMLNLNGTSLFIEDSEVLTNKPNFSRVTLNGNGLTFQVFGRKGKELSGQKVYPLD
jgi:alkaline phosphatase D